MCVCMHVYMYRCMNVISCQFRCWRSRVCMFLWKYTRMYKRAPCRKRACESSFVRPSGCLFFQVNIHHSFRAFHLMHLSVPTSICLFVDSDNEWSTSFVRLIELCNRQLYFFSFMYGFSMDFSGSCKAIAKKKYRIAKSSRTYMNSFFFLLLHTFHKHLM